MVTKCLRTPIKLFDKKKKKKTAQKKSTQNKKNKKTNKHTNKWAFNSVKETRKDGDRSSNTYRCKCNSSTMQNAKRGPNSISYLFHWIFSTYRLFLLCMMSVCEYTHNIYIYVQENTKGKTRESCPFLVTEDKAFRYDSKSTYCS